jgi:uncharacterized membrane protein
VLSSTLSGFSRDTFANGINNTGQIVGYSSTGAFVRDADGHFTTIDIQGAGGTFAFGINNVGQIVGSYSMSDGLPPFHGFVRDPGGASPQSTSLEQMTFMLAGSMTPGRYSAITHHLIQTLASCWMRRGTSPC